MSKAVPTMTISELIDKLLEHDLYNDEVEGFLTVRSSRDRKKRRIDLPVGDADVRV